MAKSKKLKKYKASLIQTSGCAPDAKFLVVIDPWPAKQAYHREFINNVAAWFEFMLRDDHPGETVRTVYTQGTHNNIIVELSELIDIRLYIGAHAHRNFLLPPYEDTEAISYIYEYDYETQNDPTRRSWTARYPSNHDMDIFPFKSHYPLPTPAPIPPIHIQYVKRSSVAIPALATTAPDDLPLADDMRSHAPSPPLLAREDEAEPQVKKRDPYEEGIGSAFCVS
ncbi:hypothetical protein C0992_003372 [Termitomyces sp. T32_za158]|nr:hypothetical protein C0992_003372 [Termitomyces sp. T32_za158]